MNPNVSQRIDAIYEEKSSIKKAKNSKVNALKHRMSDAKWRINLNNGFNVLKSIIAPKIGNNSKGKPKQLSRFQILKSTLDFIDNKESIIKKLTNEKAVKYKNDSIVGNTLDQIKNVFDLMESKSIDEFKNSLNLKTNNTTIDININDIQFEDHSSDHKIDSLSSNDNNIEMLAKIALNMSQIDDNHKEVNQSINYSESINTGIDIPCIYYLNPESINSFQCYQTYSVQIPEESDSFKAYFDRKVERNDCLTTDLVEYLSTNIPLTTMSSLTYLTDCSFGSHSQDFSYNLTPFNRIEDFDESMNRKKKRLDFSVESRPIRCRRKLDWSESSADTQWPGIMNLIIDEKASGDGLNANDLKIERNKEVINLNEDQCKGDGILSKDLQNIEVEDLCISNLNIDECLQSLNTKEDFEFQTLNNDEQHIEENIDRNKETKDLIDLNKVYSEVIENIDETKLLDFMNSSASFRSFKCSNNVRNNVS